MASRVANLVSCDRPPKSPVIASLGKARLIAFCVVERVILRGVATSGNADACIALPKKYKHRAKLSKTDRALTKNT